MKAWQKKYGHAKPGPKVPAAPKQPPPVTEPSLPPYCTALGAG
jgi:hypothetical protein